MARVYVERRELPDDLRRLLEAGAPAAVEFTPPIDVVESDSAIQILLDLPGVGFTPTDERYYPMGAIASHVLGGVQKDNIGLEGVILGGAFGAFLGATHGGTAFGYSTAVLSGVLVMLLFAACTLGMGADQIITGTAITLLSLGATGTLYRTMYGASGPALPIAAGTTLPIPLRSTKRLTTTTRGVL